MQDMLKEKIEHLGLSKRTSNALRYSNIFFIWQLVNFDKQDFLTMPILDRKALNEIIEKIEQHNLNARCLK